MLKKNKQNDPLDPLDWGRGSWKSQSDASVLRQVSVFCVEWGVVVVRTGVLSVALCEGAV